MQSREGRQVSREVMLIAGKSRQADVWLNIQAELLENATRSETRNASRRQTEARLSNASS